MEDLRILDSQLTAKSYDIRFSFQDGKKAYPRCARLKNQDCAWCARHGNGQYLQVNLLHDFIVTGIATQGFKSSINDYYVKKYMVSYSRDGNTWSFFPVSINLTFHEINKNNDCDDYKIIFYINSDIKDENNNNNSNCPYVNKV